MPLPALFTAGRTPKVFGIVALLVTLPAVALWCAKRPGLHRPAQLQPGIDVQAQPVREIEAFTDGGTNIPLFAVEFLSPAADVEQFAQRVEADQRSAIRLRETNAASNCHGWVFTAGQYSLRDFDVPAILRENDYTEIQGEDDVRENDLVVFATADSVTHSGIVRHTKACGRIVVESKWGPFGVYLHDLDQHPYAGECRFYRSPRGSHLLTLRWRLSYAQTPE